MLYDLAITLFIHYALRVLLGPTSEQEGASFIQSESDMSPSRRRSAGASSSASLRSYIDTSTETPSSSSSMSDRTRFGSVSKSCRPVLVQLCLGAQMYAPEALASVLRTSSRSFGGSARMRSLSSFAFAVLSSSSNATFHLPNDSGVTLVPAVRFAISYHGQAVLREGDSLHLRLERPRRLLPECAPSCPAEVPPGIHANTEKGCTPSPASPSANPPNLELSRTIPIESFA